MTAKDIYDEKAHRAQMMQVAGVCAAVAGVFLVIPTALGAALWYPLRRRVQRREWAVVTALASLAVLLTWSETVGGYLSWVKRLVVGPDRLSVPWLALLCLAVLAAGVAGLLSGTVVADQVMTRLNLRGAESDDLIPTQAEVNRLYQAKPPASDVVIGHDSHSLVTGGEPGSRMFPLGVNRKGEPEYLGEAEVKTHMVVLGSTGSGKTETLKNLAGNLMDLGWQVVVLDLKEDTEAGGLRDFLRTYAYGHALYYQELALSQARNQFWFNPLYGMTLDEAVNTITSLQTFDDGYWQAINRTMIGQIVTLFYDAHQADPETYPPADMYTIGQTLRQPDLKAATKKMVELVVSTVPGREVENFGALVKPSDADRQSAAGLGARIINMYESEAGRMVLRAGDGRQVMDVTAGGVCYIGLNTLGLSELARIVSTSVLLRLAALAGQRTTGQVEKGTTRIAVIIDEANWVDRKNVQNLLSRARSAGLSVILATQGANDWNDENGQDWEKIVNNVNVGIIMRQGGPESAELCAEYIGKKRTQKVVNQIREGEATGSASVQEVEDYHISPDGLRNLLIGQAIVRVGTPQFRLNWVKVAQRDPHLHAGGLMSPRPDRPTTRTVPRPPMMKDGVSSLQQSASVPAPSEPPAAEPPAPDDDGWVSL